MKNNKWYIFKSARKNSKSNKSREVKFLTAISKYPETPLQKLTTPFLWSPFQTKFLKFPSSVKLLNNVYPSPFSEEGIETDVQKD